jgi:hypothetical protein
MPTTPIIGRVLAVAALAGLAFMLPGCLIGGSSHTVTNGTAIENTDIADIIVGTTRGDELLARHGAPSTRIDRPDGTSTWRWCQTTTRSGDAQVFLLLNSNNSNVTTRCTSVDLRDGVVTGVRGE